MRAEGLRANVRLSVGGEVIEGMMTIGLNEHAAARIDGSERRRKAFRLAGDWAGRSRQFGDDNASETAQASRIKPHTLQASACPPEALNGR